MLVTVADRTVTLAFQPLDVIRWFRCRINARDVQDETELMARVAEGVFDIAQQNPDLPLVVRVQLEGETAWHGTLLGSAEYYRSAIENAVYGVLPGRIWIEKIAFRTQPPPPAPHQVTSSHLANLEHILSVIGADPDFLSTFAHDMARIQSHLGAYVKSAEAAVIDDAEDARRLLPDAQALLMHLMTQEEPSL
jgi:hypothetical protein